MIDHTIAAPEDRRTCASFVQKQFDSAIAEAEREIEAPTCVRPHSELLVEEKDKEAEEGGEVEGEEVEGGNIRPTRPRRALKPAAPFSSSSSAVSAERAPAPERKRRRDSSALTTSELDDSQTWVCCDRCSKWRRLPPTEEQGQPMPGRWECSMHPEATSEGRLTMGCSTPEDAMGDDEVVANARPSKRASLQAPIDEDDNDEFCSWVCCDRCSKWRSLPLDHELPEDGAAWDCSMNPRATHNRCEVAEERLGEDEVEEEDRLALLAEEDLAEANAASTRAKIAARLAVD